MRQSTYSIVFLSCFLPGYTLFAQELQPKVEPTSTEKLEPLFEPLPSSGTAKQKLKAESIGAILCGCPKPHHSCSTCVEQQTVVQKNDVQVEAHAAYRLRSVRIDPIALSDEIIREISWTEQRGRLDLSAKLEGIAKLTIQVDILDGVLAGDNGDFLSEPHSNSGVSLSAKRPNLTRWEVGLKKNGDPLKTEDYGPVLRAADPLEINYLYADFNLPIGLLRVGRQPLNYGAAISAHDGGRYNRFGVSKYSDGVDRILFATKLDEIYHALAQTEDHTPSTSEKEGLIFGAFYDFLKQDELDIFSDDLRQIGATLQWRVPEANWLGLRWRDLMVSQALVHLRNDEFESSLFGLPFILKTKVNDFTIRAQYIHIDGQTAEISEGFAALASKPAERQRVVANGAQLIVDYARGPVTLTGELDYASGDTDPRSTTPITSFSFSRDLNVGMLLFEHILAFESARSAGVGIENLSGSEVRSFPITEAKTDGRFTNAMAVFPQMNIRVLDMGKHRISTRLGGLFAWSATAEGAVDPIRTALAEDGKEIKDDALNYHGGKPARYYGAELDFQLRYALAGAFFWSIESAVLFPGPALYDEHGDAVRSFLLENRFELVF